MALLDVGNLFGKDFTAFDVNVTPFSVGRNKSYTHGTSLVPEMNFGT